MSSKVTFSKFGYMQATKQEKTVFISILEDRATDMPCICFTVAISPKANFNYAYQIENGLFYRESEHYNSILGLAYYAKVSKDSTDLADKFFYLKHEKITSF